MRRYLRPIEPEAVKFDSSVELVDLKEAATFLKISVPTLRRMQQQREILFIKIGGRIRFAKSDLVT